MLCLLWLLGCCTAVAGALELAELLSGAVVVVSRNVVMSYGCVVGALRAWCGVVCDSGRRGLRGLSPFCCISAARSPHGAVPSSCLVLSEVVAWGSIVFSVLLGTCMPGIWLGLTIITGRAEMRCLFVC